MENIDYYHKVTKEKLKKKFIKTLSKDEIEKYLTGARVHRNIMRSYAYNNPILDRNEKLLKKYLIKNDQ